MQADASLTNADLAPVGMEQRTWTRWDIAALLRGVVACGWFGIQTWFGGAALHATLAILFGFDTTGAVPLAGLGVTAAQLACFLAFWAMNVFFIWNGMESIKWLEKLSAPFLLVVGVLLMVWAVTKAGGFGAVFAASSSDKATTWVGFGAGLTAMVGFWATLSLNIPDFSRYAKSQRDQIFGQAIALPTTMAFYSFIGILIMPWKLVADPSGYIFTWLIGYGALLGPIAGIMIADYHVLRKRALDVTQLYQRNGIYHYTGGFNLAAVVAFLLAVLPNLPGFLAQTGVIGAVHPWLTMIYQQAWFVGFGLAFVLYLLFRKISPTPI